MINGRVVQVNDLSAKAWQETAGRNLTAMLTSERSLTWSVRAPEDNEITAGRWWSADSTEAEVSLEQGYAEDFDLGLGDRMEFDVGGRKSGQP